MSVLAKMIISILGMVAIFFAVFYQIATTEADEQKARAEHLFRDVVKYQDQAERAAATAEEQAAESQEVIERLQAELDECKSGK